MTERNIDLQEINKFEDLARKWWDPDSEFKPLHDINPLRINYIRDRIDLSSKRILDVGCGGGLLSEALAAAGAEVLGIDAGEKPLQVAKLHLHESRLEIEYRQLTIEELAQSNPEPFDIITCLEVLEHVPSPGSIIKTCRQLVKDDGHLFFSTINRNLKSYLFAIIGGEYLLNLLPRGTHDYHKLITPSELALHCRRAKLEITDFSGITYHPITQIYKLGKNVDVNYLAYARPS